ncbi:hypothetical protein [Actinomadura rudentiformis]|uniref:Uncharacterized protein n=1 Tax=Actinomadura rudentiformis TaxID=359158 RepID=A0A6H9YTK4_9ACTN|nr:hypothetical protein [Actinomadura rudentiformis]KAB2350201.1 hypothetical protein F8566_10445 [Actinomadura rudentiformis]
MTTHHDIVICHLDRLAVAVNARGRETVARYQPDLNPPRLNVLRLGMEQVGTAVTVQPHPLLEGGPLYYFTFDGAELAPGNDPARAADQAIRLTEQPPVIRTPAVQPPTGQPRPQPGFFQPSRPHADQARILESKLGVQVWHGGATGSWWAIDDSGLVEAATAQELEAKMARVQARSQQTAGQRLTRSVHRPPAPPSGWPT